MHDKITVCENGQPLTFSFAEINRYHGGGFPGGITHALKAMQAAFPLLSGQPLERRDIQIVTAFSGPGGRDAMEMVTRALTDGRLSIDKTIGGRDVISAPPGPYVWRFSYRGKQVEVRIRPGHVREEFVRLGAKADRNREENDRLEFLKSEMANRLLPLPAGDIYEVIA